MSTNSIVAVFKEWGDVRSVYCHWDGYVEWNGKMLLTHFDSLEKAAALVAGGDMSSIEERGAVNYYKDRGDDWNDIKPITYNNLDEMFADLKYSSNIEFVYAYVNGLGWTYRDMNSGECGLVKDYLEKNVEYS